jgi:hypothetical protein
MMPRMAYRVIGVDCEATTIAFLSCAASERDLSDPLRWLVHVVEERCDRDSLDGWDDGMMRYRSQDTWREPKFKIRIQNSLSVVWCIPKNRFETVFDYYDSIPEENELFFLVFGGK